MPRHNLQNAIIQLLFSSEQPELHTCTDGTIRLAHAHRRTMSLVVACDNPVAGREMRATHGNASKAGIATAARIADICLFVRGHT